VQNGRPIVDQPTELPEGMVFDLVIDDEGDDLDDEERAALHEALARSDEQVKQGLTLTAADVLKDLRKRR
jgi:hypothetical protein